MRQLGLIGLLMLMVSFANAQGADPVGKSTSVRVQTIGGKKQVFNLKSAKGSVAAELYEFRLTTTESTGKARPASLFVVFEPQSTSFWWIYQMGHNRERAAPERMARFLKEHKFIFAGDRVVGFHMSGMNQIVVRASSATQKNVDEGVNSATAIIQASLSKKQLELLFSGKEINARQIVGQEFFLSKSLEAVDLRPAELSDATWDGSRWALALLGPNKTRNLKDPNNRDKAVLYLDNDFNVSRAMINGQSVYPK